MRLDRSSSPFGGNNGSQSAIFRRTPVVVGAALTAVGVAFVGLYLANALSSSSCDTDSGVACDATDVIAATGASQVSVPVETASSTGEPGHDMSDHDTADHDMPDRVLVVSARPVATEPDSLASVPSQPDSSPTTPVANNPDPASVDPIAPTPTNPKAADSKPAPVKPDPIVTTPTKPVVTTPTKPVMTTPTKPVVTTSTRPVADYVDISTFGVFHSSSNHTHGDSLAGGRTAITTEALVSYNGLRTFLGQGAVELDTIGRWAFANNLTNNGQAFGQDLKGVGLYYGMQAAKVGWIRDNAYDPQLLADIQRTAREGRTSAVMTMVEASGHPGYADYLTQSGLVDVFINTLKMEPHYGGWMHGRVHGGSPFRDGSDSAIAVAHDVNHLTVLSHDQTQPFMNDGFDWPQWPALDVPDRDVINYFQSMVVLGDPHGNALP